MTEPTTPKRRRSRGDGALFQDASGRWRGAIVAKDPQTGQSVRHSVSGRTMAMVRERLDKLRRDIEATGRPSARTTVAEFLAGWLRAEAQRVRPATWRGRELQVRRYIVPTLGSLALVDLRPSDVERMTSSMMKAGRAGMTARHARATLRRALGDAERDGLILRNVVSLSRPPRITRPEIHVLTADETRRLLEGTQADALGPLYAVAATTGLRQGELLGLTWADVDGLDAHLPPSRSGAAWRSPPGAGGSSPSRRQRAAGGRSSSGPPRPGRCAGNGPARRRHGSPPPTLAGPGRARLH